MKLFLKKLTPEIIRKNFVRCAWHGVGAPIVWRETGIIAPDRLYQELNKRMPQNHGMCKPCAERVERESKEYIKKKKGLIEGPME